MMTAEWSHWHSASYSEVAVSDSLQSRNRPTLNLYRKKNLVRRLVSLFVLSLLFLESELHFLYYATKLYKQSIQFLLYLRRSYFFNAKTSTNTDGEKIYECYFGCKVGDQDKKWGPHVCCISCATILREWLNNKWRSMLLPLP